MRKMTTTFAALAATTMTVAAAPATAQAVGAVPAFSTQFTDGDYTLPAYTNATVFQNFAGLPDNTAYTPRAGEAVAGDVRTMQGTLPGTAVQPTSSDDNTYLDIVNGSYGVTFGAPVQFFSFVLGSLDNYNSLTLTFANGATDTLTGRQIVGDTATGPFNSGTSGRVSYDVGGGSGITGALFTSNQAAFEIDSLASAVPEASTWAMMMVGVGAIGAAARRRKVATSVRFA